MYEIETNDITLARGGSLLYIQGDRIIYLLMLAANDTPHYIYIKNIGYLLHARKILEQLIIRIARCVDPCARP